MAHVCLADIVASQRDLTRHAAGWMSPSPLSHQVSFVDSSSSHLQSSRQDTGSDVCVHLSGFFFSQSSKEVHSQRHLRTRNFEAL